MAWEHLRYESNGRTFKVTENGQDTGRFVYKSFMSQKNVDLGNGNFAPYVWDEPSQSIRYGSHVCEFDVDGFQTIREYGSVETLIDDQRFELQYWQTQAGGRWRILDLWQIGLTVDQQDDYCIITRNLSDGDGNTLDIDFLFKPMEKVKLAFRLHVVEANLYRIRFQNTGLAGEVTEVPFVEDETQVDLGVVRLVFENIWFGWEKDEIGIHEGYTIEDQAGGKKLDLFLGDFDLPDDGNIVISPDTWGYTDATQAEDYDRTADNYDPSGTRIYVGCKASPSLTTCGFRFLNVTVPADSTINSAYLRCYHDSTFAGPVYAKFRGVKESDTAAFAEGDHWEDRAQTTAAVDWDIVDDPDYGGLVLPNPDIASIIDELTDSVGNSWSSGNDMGIWADDDGSANWDRVEMFDHTITGYEPDMEIDYTPAAVGVAPTGGLYGPLVGPMGGPI